jgi:hypothetical protein
VSAFRNIHSDAAAMARPVACATDTPARAHGTLLEELPDSPEELAEAIPEVLEGWGEAFNEAVNWVESMVELPDGTLSAFDRARQRAVPR